MPLLNREQLYAAIRVHLATFGQDHDGNIKRLSDRSIKELIDLIRVHTKPLK